MNPRSKTPGKTMKRVKKALPSRKALDAYQIIHSPVCSEAAMKKIEDHNTLVFVCDVRASKAMIKSAVKKLYNIDTLKITTMVCPRGTKKAHVRLPADVDATDVANRIGFV